MAILRQPTTQLLIVGEGPEKENLRKLAGELTLDVAFLVSKSGARLAEILNRHQIIAIPSRWPEPFGVGPALKHLHLAGRVLPSRTQSRADCAKRSEIADSLSPV